MKKVLALILVLITLNASAGLFYSEPTILIKRGTTGPADINGEDISIQDMNARWVEADFFFGDGSKLTGISAGGNTDTIRTYTATPPIAVNNDTNKISVVTDFNLWYHSIIDLNTFYFKKADVNAAFVPYVGADYNLNMGTSKSITATNFVSTATTGIQPYACTSTTKNTNLNADYADGYSFNQLLLTSNTPVFAGAHLGAAYYSSDFSDCHFGTCTKFWGDIEGTTGYFLYLTWDSSDPITETWIPEHRANIPARVQASLAYGGKTITQFLNIDTMQPEYYRYDTGEFFDKDWNLVEKIVPLPLKPTETYYTFNSYTGEVVERQKVLPTYKIKDGYNFDSKTGNFTNEAGQIVPKETAIETIPKGAG